MVFRGLLKWDAGYIQLNQKQIKDRSRSGYGLEVETDIKPVIG